MKFIIYFIIIIITVILQVSVVPNLAIGGAFPNLILIVGLILSFSNLKTPALWWLAIGGLLLDIYSPMHFGVYTLLFLGVYYLIYFLSSRFISEFSLVSIAIGFFVCSLMIDIILLLLGNKDWLILLGNAIYTTIVGVIIYYLISERIQPKRGEYKIS